MLLLLFEHSVFYSAMDAGESGFKISVRIFLSSEVVIFVAFSCKRRDLSVCPWVG